MWFLTSLVNAVARHNKAAPGAAPKSRPLTEAEYFGMWREPLLRRVWRRLTGK